MGVMSVMLVILIPSALSARTEDSRPGQILMRTSRFLMPHSCATLPARFGRNLGGERVLLREP